jgi:hypothetical protein
MVMTFVKGVPEGGLKRNQEREKMKKIRRNPEEIKRALCRKRRFIILFPALIKVPLENNNSSQLIDDPLSFFSGEVSL